MSEQALKIGVVTALFNRPVTEKLEQGALNRLTQEGFGKEQVLAVQVPGAFEIPLAAKALFEVGCHAVVAVGAVIRGETAHFDYVCSAVERGCMDIQLQYNRPIGFGVITTENAEQAFERAGGRRGNKGTEASEVVLEMLKLQKNLS